MFADEIQVQQVGEYIPAGDLQTVLFTMGNLIEQAKVVAGTEAQNLIDQITTKLFEAQDLLQGAQGAVGLAKLNYLMENFTALAQSLNYQLPQFQEPVLPRA